MTLIGFFRSAKAGDISGIRAAIDAGLDVNARALDGRTALMVSAHDGRTAAVALLIRAGADPDARDNAGYTAMMMAALHGHQETARTVHAAADRVGLVEAAMIDDTEAIESLVQQGAGIDAIDEAGFTPLMAAAACGTSASLRLLIRLGADTNKPGRDDTSPLTYAVARGHIDLVRTLVLHGAEPDGRLSGGPNAVVTAVDLDQAEALEVLLDARADVQDADDRGNTLLHHAAALGRVDACGVLLRHGADINARNPRTGQTPLMYTLVQGFFLGRLVQGRRRVSLLLVESGADVHVTDAQGFTALDLANQTHDAEVIRALRRAGRKRPSKG